MLILVYPWRYSPPVLYGRWRIRGGAGKGQSDKQPGNQTGADESTRDLVRHESEDPVPLMPSLKGYKDRIGVNR